MRQVTVLSTIVGTNHITNISSFTAGSIYTYAHFAKFGQQFVCSVNDSRDLLLPGISNLLRPIVEETRILSTAPTQSKSSMFIINASCAIPFHTEISPVFFPVKISQTGFCSGTVGMHNVAIFRIAA